MNIRATEVLLNILIFIGVLVLLFVVGYPQYKELQPSLIKIGVDKSFGTLPFYIANMDTSHPYFTIEKISPEFQEITGDPLPGLKRGDCDIATVPWYWLILNPSNNGDTVKVLGSLELKAFTDAVIIPQKSKIKFVKDLTGKRLGYLSTDEYLVNLILPKLELENLKNVVKVPLQPEEVATAIKENRVDALYLLDPYRGYMLYQGDTILTEGLISRYVMPSLPYMAIVMRKNFLKENRLAAFRIKNVVDATLGYLRIHPEVGKSTLIKIKDWPSEGMLILNIRMPEYQRLMEIDLRQIEKLQTLLVQAGMGSCGMKPEEFLFKRTDFTK